jgi:hypothetical protein
MSAMSTVDVHFTVIVPVAWFASCFMDFVIWGIVAMRFRYWVFDVLGGVCIILRGVIFGLFLGYAGIEM